MKVYLVITSWVGYLGIHFYGSLWCRGKREDIRWVPPDSYRKMLNDYEEKRYKLKAGEKTSRFLRAGDIEIEAITQWKTIFPEAQILFKGNPIYEDIKDLPILDRK